MSKFLDDALVPMLLAAWLAAGIGEGVAYLRRRRKLSDLPGSVPGATAGDRPHNPGREHEHDR